jgi:hypothetical protein
MLSRALLVLLAATASAAIARPAPPAGEPADSAAITDRGRSLDRILTRLVRSYAWSSLRTVATALFPCRRFDWNGAGFSANGPPAQRARVVAVVRTWWASVER